MTKKEKQITIFRLVYRNDKPSTTGRHYPVSHRIPSIDEVYDEATKRNRKIQYVLGEQSIYADEQSSFNPVLGDIVFNNGSLPVQYQQVTLREFLEKTNYNARAMDVNVERSMYEIKHDMMVIAKSDPVLFMEEISNPKLERKQIIMEAEDERFISINTSLRQVKWGIGSKQMITVIPVGINPYDHFVDYTFESEGQEVFNKIVKLLKGDTPKKEKVVKSK